MIINKIRLENIRSYTDEQIDFPEGIVLLSGDVGSGKSTILLAIEFALFGLLKGDLTGATLLRNGTNKGSVELHLKFDNNRVIIKRTLKRSSGSISQDSGSFTINDETRQLSPVEIKQNALNMINYPKEFLTQTKSLIYRYTVYTPQEEMKNILLGFSDLRLDILRKIFGIDKYKKIKENSKIFLSKLKERRNELLAKVEDLGKENDEKKEAEKKLIKLENDKNLVVEDAKELKINIISLKKEIEDKEELSNKIKELKNSLNILDLRIENENSRLKRIGESRESLISEIENLRKDISFDESGFKELETKINEKETESRSLEGTIRDILNRLQDIRTRKVSSQSIIKKVAELNVCPLCKQKVSHDHKSLISSEENDKIKNLENEFNDLSSRNTILNKEYEKNKEALNYLRELKNKVDIINLKKFNIDNMNKKISAFDRESEGIIKNISDLDNKRKKITDEIKEIPVYNIDIIKKNLEGMTAKERNLEIGIARTEKEIESSLSELNRLNNSISRKTKIKNNIDKIEEILHLTNEYFLSLVDVMEKNIMAKIYDDFNSLFQKWFNVLMNEENISVALENDFTPVIEQNGYHIQYDNLSGGEKTAAALAYRLALNQVINNIVSTIKTKDIIILDEPTDGFSEEQIDRIRDVLNELNMKQIIIVSHEPKIETFVDTVIRLQKNEHVTKIIS